MDVVELCLAGDEAGARAAADAAGALGDLPGDEDGARVVGAAATRRRDDWAGRRASRSTSWRPGAVETPLLQATREDKVIGQFIDAFPIPSGRKGTAEELAAFVAFLLGPDARFFCGSVVFVDGGTDAQMRAGRLPGADGARRADRPSDDDRLDLAGARRAPRRLRGDLA